MNLAEEKQLLIRIKENPEFFGKLFDEYYKIIFNYIFHRVADYDISRDIAADTFLKAYLKVKSFIWKDISILFWLYRIATNEVNYYYRNNKTYRLSAELFANQVSKLFEFEEYDHEKQLMEQELKLNDDFKKAQKALKKLNIKYQEVLSLRYFEKKSILEISEILDKKEGTIKSLLSRGLEKLKIEFNNAT
jgi:RNA polymerase sigma factor (sigma-70 family)